MHDLILALYAVGASAVFVGTYALGHYHGRAYVSDRTFGPVAAWGRIEAASDALEVALDEPVPYWPAPAARIAHCGCGASCARCS